MDNRVNLGDGVPDKACELVNAEFIKLLEKYVPRFFAWLDNKMEHFPEATKRLFNGLDAKQELPMLWSEFLAESGIIPEAYGGLPDTLLISNFHQEGYLSGLYAGYALAMMALVDNHAPVDTIVSVRDFIRPNLMGHRYDNQQEFVTPFKSEKYSWVETAKKSNQESD